jgi:putative flippase GtrA
MTDHLGVAGRPRAKLFLNAQFGTFLLTGGVAACVNIASRWVFERAVSYEAAVALAYLAGMVTAFLLARLFVFEHDDQRVGGQFARFALVNAVAFVQVWLVSVGLADLAFPAIGFGWHADTVAHVIGVISPVAASFLLHKHFSFRPATR